MYDIDVLDPMRFSFAKNANEMAVVILDEIIFQGHRKIASCIGFDKLSDEQSSVFVIGNKRIATHSLPKEKQYLFIGVENLIYDTYQYPFAISTAVADIEIAKLIISDALGCSEEREGIAMSPADFRDIADAKILKFISLDDESAIRQAKTLWYCAAQTRALMEASNNFNNILKIADKECDAVFTVSSSKARDKDYLIAADLYRC